MALLSLICEMTDRIFFFEYYLSSHCLPIYRKVASNRSDSTIEALLTLVLGPVVEDRSARSSSLLCIVDHFCTKAII